MTDNASRYKTIAMWLGVCGGIVSLAAGALYWAAFRRTGISGRPEDWGQLGSYFGGVAGTLVSLAALIALAINLHLQAQELQETRAELKGQRRAMDLQAFEGTFFKLLQQYEAAVKNLHVQVNGGNWFDGHAAVKIISGELRNKFHPHRIYTSEDHGAKAAQAYYLEVFRERQGDLVPCFRLLYHVFSFIDRSEQPSEEKARYASIARAHLSQDEILLLFYNCTMGEGLKFRPLIEHYGVFKHIVREGMLHPAHLDRRDWYDVSAFQSYKDRLAKADGPSLASARHEPLGLNTPPG